MVARWTGVYLASVLIALAAKAVERWALIARRFLPPRKAVGEQMANIVNQTITVTGPATAQLLDWRASQFQVGIAYVVPAGTTATATVEHTYDADPSSASAVWFPSTVIAAATVSKEEYIQTPCAAVRLNVASISGGPVFLKIVKAG